MSQHRGKNSAIAIAALAVLFALVQPLVPQCSMAAAGDCAMEENQANADGCGDCPPALCVLSVCGAPLVAVTTADTIPRADVESTSDQAFTAYDVVLTGRVDRPPGHPPKA
ncbi:MAG: hypothetical protein HOH20_15415 [Rhodospirillaceae bacterium]|jgi:hypothetical protein|nr:hypothetical protein [Rhodospirillaceae bacterium]MBT5241010.1 hypothetical protein [Rhodospirillaceae bacterium]MBT5564626.1 hypothetical protein [Rhodospirillaceae bacterium]MBT6090961.1 hypothetical protein [Rhodospirillaceae bacterium]